MKCCHAGRSASSGHADNYFSAAGVVLDKSNRAYKSPPIVRMGCYGSKTMRISCHDCEPLMDRLDSVGESHRAVHVAAGKHGRDDGPW